MKTLSCESCGQEKPMQDMLNISGHQLCQVCGEKFFQERPNLSRQEATKHVDPTICVNCGKDNGDTPHELLTQQPTCAACIAFFRNRPFPRWIKASFVALIGLVVFSLVWNWRFFQGHFESRAAFRAFFQGNVAEASEQMTAAVKHIPESQYLQVVSLYVQGTLDLKERKCEEALKCFRGCGGLSPAFQVPLMIHYAELGAAFDKKDYDGFLQASEAIAKDQPLDPIARAQVASALACKYAVSGDEQLRLQAEEKLAEAKKLGNKALQASRYEERIRFRLETREIIDTKEFDRRFPNGWNPNKQGDKL
ncbi:MAG: hypothetical protein ACWGMZ_09480 [Thermoguttaceae bacterium]